MRVREVELERLVPYARNPRNNAQAVDKVAASLREFGWKQPIVVDADMTVVAGHTRLLAAKKLNLAKAPIVIADDLTPEQVKAYRLADNRIAEDASWDIAGLVGELTELKDLDFDLGPIGFDETELTRILNPVEELDISKEWEGMPEYISENKTALQSVIVHFKTKQDIDAFSNLIDQTITDKTKSLWYPRAEIESYADKVYDGQP